MKRNGAGKVFDYVFDKLGIGVERMYFDADGTYPNHVPNPMEEENVEELKRKVLKRGADFGIALDGDADRLIIVDEKKWSESEKELLATLSSPTAVAVSNALAYEELRQREAQSLPSLELFLSPDVHAATDNNVFR